MAVPTNQPLPDDPTPPRLFPQLPDDISLRCIARVPRSSHPDLALVSPSWRSHLRPPLLFNLRSDLGVTEPSLCINILHNGEVPRWYLLIRGHHRRPGRLLPLPPMPIPTRISASAVLDQSLFVPGGISTSAAQIFNPRTNCWSLGPQMGTVRNGGATASTLGGRIYVVGGCPRESDSWAEAFDYTSGDYTSGVWAHVPSPPHLREEFMDGSAVLGGRLLAVGSVAGVVFDPAAAEPWTAVSESLFTGWRTRATIRVAVVNEVLYSYDNKWKLNGYDPVTDDWKPVEGIEEELPNNLYDLINSKLSNLGGLLCVVWSGSWRNSEEAEINCVGIEITRTSSGGLWGSVAWRESAPIAMAVGSRLGPCMALEF